MRRLFLWSALALSLAGATGGPVAVLHAATVEGTAITIGGLNDLNATAHNEVKKGSGKTLAILTGLGGLATLFAGRVGLGLGGVGAGIGMGFVPGIMSSAFDAAPAATLEVTAPVVSAFAGHWWTPALAAAYPPLLVLKFLQDPVFLTCLALLLVARSVVRSARAVATR